MSDGSAPLKTSCHRKPSVVMMKMFGVSRVWLSILLPTSKHKTRTIVFITGGFAKETSVCELKMMWGLWMCYEKLQAVSCTLQADPEIRRIQIDRACKKYWTLILLRVFLCELASYIGELAVI